MDNLTGMVDVGITLAIATARVTMYLTAEAKVLGSQSYEMGDRKLTRADLGEIRQGLSFWQAEVQRLSPTRPQAVGRVRRASYRSR